jgi:uncharacterized protein (TIGR03083 family)
MRDERAALLTLLASLTPEEWDAATTCPGWTVKDIAAHLIADDLGILSRERDSYRPPDATAETTWTGVVELVNRQNEAWVAAMRRFSPAVILQLLASSGPPMFAFFDQLDPEGIGPPVAWAGPQPAKHGLRIAREYTERWVHHKQIRDALGRTGLMQAGYLGPLLDTFAHSLPVALSRAKREDGIRVRLIALGDGGGAWEVISQAGDWRLGEVTPGMPAASVQIAVDDLWRLYTNGIDRSVARTRASVDGDPELIAAVFDALAIIA